MYGPVSRQIDGNSYRYRNCADTGHGAANPSTACSALTPAEARYQPVSLVQPVAAQPTVGIGGGISHDAASSLSLLLVAALVLLVPAALMVLGRNFIRAADRNPGQVPRRALARIPVRIPVRGLRWLGLRR